jgi:hypothetical protein
MVEQRKAQGGDRRQKAQQKPGNMRTKGHEDRPCLFAVIGRYWASWKLLPCLSLYEKCFIFLRQVIIILE